MFVFPELFLLTGGRGRDEGDGRRHSRSGERHAGGVGLKVLRVVGSGAVAGGAEWMWIAELDASDCPGQAAFMYAVLSPLRQHRN
jgi:hypothetical protein